MSSAFDLGGKVALVTGSTRGIGFATAQLLAELGAQVIVSSEHEAETAEAARCLQATALACD